MLSPTGQFIVPSSCPAFLLVNFLSTNLEKAKQVLENYERYFFKSTIIPDQELNEFFFYFFSEIKRQKSF
jgi:hypothetical protein